MTRSRRQTAILARNLLSCVAFSAMVFWCLPVLQGQQSEQPVFRTETALIEVEVRATGRGGRPVGDLGREDFTIFEEGHQQEIAAFEYVPPPAAEQATAATPQTRTETAPGAPARAARAAGEDTLIYIASRVGAMQRKATYEAIKEFIETNLRPGIRISLDGLPFLSNKQKLLELLDLMLNEGGKNGIPSFVNLAAASADEEIATITAFTGITSPTHLSTTPSTAHMTRLHLERALVQDYTALINQLGVYPGKKVLVLFSRGLRFDAENAMYWRQLAATAMRARVVMHAIDVRGLVAMPRDGDATSPGSMAVEAESGAAGMPPFTRPELADKPSSLRDLQFSQQGLMSLVEGTGGKAVVNDNDLGKVFTNVLAELGGYYVLGYYPREQRQRGRFCEIRVEVDRPGVKLSFREGYFEEKEFSKLSSVEKRRRLEGVLFSNEMPSEIPLKVNYEFFRGEDGQPLAAYGVGIDASALPATETKKGAEVDLVMLAKAESADSALVPFGDEQSLQLVFKPDEFKRMQDDATAMLQFPSAMRLPPGAFRWKFVVGDLLTGRIGAFQSAVEVPDFKSEPSPSSLLLTGRIISASEEKNDKKKSGEPRGVDVGEFRFYPSPENLFRQGTAVHAVYGLYNVTPALVEAPPAPRVFLLLGDKPLDRPPFTNYEAFPSADRQELHYIATLDTASLEPGAYRLLVALPNGKDAIYKDFTLVGN